MTSRERVLSALSHRQPDRVPVDFGSTPVTGVHVSCIAALRDYFGLPKSIVRCHEPFQMLGILDDDLKEVLGIDAEGVAPPATMFGFHNRDWKTWRMPDGLEILVSGEFRTTTDTNGDILTYPEGDLDAPPSGRMPKDGYFFDAIVRQPPVHEHALKPEDNLEEFKPVSAEDVAEIKQAVEAANATGRAVVANFGGTAFGDIALVPATFLKYPKGIRDISEWYMSTASRRDYIHTVFARQCDIAIANLTRIFAAVGNTVDIVFLCGTDFGTQTSSFCSVQTFRELYFPDRKSVV